MKNTPICLTLGLAVMLAIPSVSKATVLENFDEYANGTSVDNGTTENTTLLQGTESLSMGGYFETPFGGPIFDETDTSALIDPSASGTFDMYFSEDSSGTPEGLDLTSGDFEIFGINSGGNGGTYDTGVAYTAGDTYLISIVSDLSAGTFEGFETNLTTGAPKVSLGTYGSYDGHTEPSFFTGGGLLIYGSGDVVDDFTLTDAAPEPTTAGMVLAALLGLTVLVKRHKILGLR